MPEMDTALVAALLAWQVVVAVLIAVLFRQVALLSIAMSQQDPPARNSNLAVGVPIPQELDSDMVDPAETTYVFWLSVGCDACVRVAEELGTAISTGAWTESTVALITGPATAATSLSDTAALQNRTIVDPDASSIIETLGLTTSPFVIKTANGVVRGWSTVTSIPDLEKLRTDPASGDTDKREEEQIASPKSEEAGSTPSTSGSHR